MGNWFAEIQSSNGTRLVGLALMYGGVRTYRLRSDSNSGNIQIQDINKLSITKLYTDDSTLYTGNINIDSIYVSYIYPTTVSNLGKPVSAVIPRPTYNTTKIGEFMYGGVDACVNATYTANSTAKLGGTSAKNKGYVTLSAPYTFPSIYSSSATTVKPTSITTGYFIKY